MVTNDEKSRIWQAYRDRRPLRVPVTLGINPRVVILDEEWNPGGITFEDCFADADAAIQVQLRYMEYLHERAHHHCDSPTGLPAEFSFYVDVQNIYDAAYFGAPLVFRDDQVPDALPYLAEGDKNRIFQMDIEHPLDNPFLQACLKRHEDLTRSAGRVNYRDVTYRVQPFVLGFDGPLTVGAALRGQEMFSDFYEDPPYVRRLMEFLTEGAILRRRALAERFGIEPFDGAGGFADDSIQLISTELYRRHVLPLHRRWYELWGPGPHGMHLCGDATRHFPTIRDELNVHSFDTGFPVDHGALRKALGPDVEISGGPEVSLLRSGTPEQVYDRARQILQSGVMEGGRFILRDANNLPPRCPQGNLAAMYRCCLEHGRYAEPAEE